MKRFSLYVIFFLSGVAGLGYELLWTRMLSVSLGHEFISLLSVVGAFFLGLALGAWIIDPMVSRSHRPGYWFAVCEVVIGLWALTLSAILPALNTLAGGWIGIETGIVTQGAVSFFFPFAVLLPATFAMGGTLPAMDRFFSQLTRSDVTVAGLYSINTFGAVIGTLGVTFFLMPTFGMVISSRVLIVFNLMAAAGVFVLQQSLDKPARHIRQEATHTSVSRMYAVLFATGLAGIGFEVLLIRVFSQVLENTVFSFAVVLSVFLFGTASGAGIYHAVSRRALPFYRTLSLLLAGLSCSTVLTLFLLQYVHPVFAFFHDLLGQGYAGAVMAEVALSFVYALIPTAFMGAVFSHLAQAVKGKRFGVGRALCVNTLGCAVAPAVFGTMLIPAAGIAICFLLVALLYLACIPQRNRAVLLAGLLVAETAVFAFLYPSSFHFITLDKGDRLAWHKQGVTSSVSVIADEKNDYHLKVNNRFQMGGTTSVFSDRRQAYLPLLLHRDPHKALFLGLGTGVTFSGAAQFPNLNAVGVELVPEVIEAMDLFKDVTGNLGADEGFKVIQADARRYVNAVDESYDVIISDLFHPARDGAGYLYTREHFAAIKSILKDGGLFCQWLPLYQMDIDMMKVITRTFIDVFPHAQLYLAHYSVDQPIIGLVGALNPLRFPERWYRRRTESGNLRRIMAGYGYDSIYSLLGTFLADEQDLKKFAEKVPLNTDDHPVVMFSAPRIVYGSHGPAKDRLLSLINTLSSHNPEAILSEVITEEDLMARERLVSYWKARDSYLKLGMTIPHTRDVVKLYDKAHAPLLAVVRKSIDFSAAYFPLISIAYDLYPYNPSASRKLLRDLERANPLRREASILRQRLFTE